MKGSRGFALLITLVVTTLMVAIMVEIIHQVYVDVSLSRGFRDGQQASLLADSANRGGVVLLQRFLAAQEYTSLADTWNKPLKLDDEAGVVEVTAVSEDSKINLNDMVLPNGELEPFVSAAIRRLGKRLNIPPDIWDALADWMDSDATPRSGGGETPYYQSLRPGYQPRNAKLLTLSELTLVKGFTPEIVNKLRPFITIYATQAGATISPVNINTASREVLAALDDRLDDSMADRIIEERRVRPFKATGELSRVPGFETISFALQGKVSVKGALFRVMSVSRVRETVRTVETVVRIAGTAPEILLWQEY